MPYDILFFTYKQVSFDTRSSLSLKFGIRTFLNSTIWEFVENGNSGFQ